MPSREKRLRRMDAEFLGPALVDLVNSHPNAYHATVTVEHWHGKPPEYIVKVFPVGLSERKYLAYAKGVDLEHSMRVAVDALKKLPRNHPGFSDAYDFYRWYHKQGSSV
jgi:hypothetical protein